MTDTAPSDTAPSDTAPSDAAPSDNAPSDAAPSVPRARIRPHRRRLASLRTITALVLREMGTTYGRSPGGYAWAVLEPAAGIALLTLIFSLAFRSPPIGINFPLFYATGLVPFFLFTDVSSKIAQALLFSKQLLAYPSVTFIDAILGRFLLNLMTQIMVAAILLGGILAVFDTRVIVDLPGAALSLAMAACLALGVGVLNCFLFTMFPVWQRVWSILMRPMFILSCILFLFETIPQPYRDWLWYNPLVHLVGLMRRAFYASYDATYVSIPYVLGFAGVTLLLGLVFLRRYNQDLLDR